MEPFDKDELSDRELDAILAAWESPPAPARLRAAVFPEASKPWWRALWSASIRVPVPVACFLVLALAFAAWRWFPPAAPRAVTKTVYRDRIVRAPADTAGSNSHQLQPVAELRVRIIRSRNAKN
ncbi:MAG: hypothetical protein ABSF25_01275 [Bryobacteraceae bacterium]|jgi:hypothetical protein